MVKKWCVLLTIQVSPLTGWSSDLLGGVSIRVFMVVWFTSSTAVGSTSIGVSSWSGGPDGGSHGVLFRDFWGGLNRCRDSGELQFSKIWRSFIDFSKICRFMGRADRAERAASISEMILRERGLEKKIQGDHCSWLAALAIFKNFKFINYNS